MLGLDNYRYHEAIAVADLGRRVGIRKKAKTLQKFGRRSIGSSGEYTIAQFADAHETLVTTNAIDSAVSSSGSDTQTLTVEGHTIDASGNLTFVVQDVTLTGQTPAPLATPLARATRAYVKNGTFAAPATNLVGSARVYDSSAAGGTSAGVPVNSVSIKMRIAAGQSNSFKAQTAISQADCLFITGLSFMATRASGSANADFQVQVKEIGGVWRSLGVDVSLRTSAQPYTFVPIFPWRYVAPNSDVRIIATVTAACDLAAHWQGILASAR